MKLLVFTVFISFAFAQFIPPWVQLPPYKQQFLPGQNPYIPQKNFTYYNAFLPWNNNNYSSNNFWSGHPAFRGKRAVYNYYQPACLPNYQQCNGSHSLFVGCLRATDKVLFQKSYVKPGRWFSKREKIVTYPGLLPPGMVRNETISAIRAYDRYCNDTGGYAQILERGVGYDSVTMRLYSDSVRKGFNFHIVIYGN